MTTHDHCHCENSSSSHLPPLDYCKSFLVGLSVLMLLFPQSILCPETRWSLLKPSMDGILSLFKRLPMASQVNKKKIQSLYDELSLYPIHCFAKLISWPPPSCSLCSSCNDPLVISHACQAGYLLLILLLDYFPPDTSVFLLSIPSLCAKITFTNMFSLALCSNISPPYFQQHLTHYILAFYKLQLHTNTHTHIYIVCFFPREYKLYGSKLFLFHSLHSPVLRTVPDI